MARMVGSFHECAILMSIIILMHELMQGVKALWCAHSKISLCPKRASAVMED